MWDTVSIQTHGTERDEGQEGQMHGLQLTQPKLGQNQHSLELQHTVQTLVNWNGQREKGILKSWWKGKITCYTLISVYLNTSCRQETTGRTWYRLNVWRVRSRGRTETRKKTMQLSEKPLVYPRYPETQGQWESFCQCRNADSWHQMWVTDVGQRGRWYKTIWESKRNKVEIIEERKERRVLLGSEMSSYCQEKQFMRQSPISHSNRENQLLSNQISKVSLQGLHLFFNTPIKTSKYTAGQI